MVRLHSRRVVALALLALAPLGITACGTPAGAATGKIVVAGSTCLAGVSPYVTLSQHGRPLTSVEIRDGQSHAFRLAPGSYVVSDGPLIQPVTVIAGRVMHVALLPTCSPRMS